MHQEEVASSLRQNRWPPGYITYIFSCFHCRREKYQSDDHLYDSSGTIGMCQVSQAAIRKTSWKKQVSTATAATVPFPTYPRGLGAVLASNCQQRDERLAAFPAQAKGVHHQTAM